MKNIKLADLNNIPEPIKNLLDESAKSYSEIPHTTNAGFFLRLLCKIFKPSTIIKMFAYKFSK